MRNRLMLLLICFLAAGFWLSSCNRTIPEKRGTATPIPATPNALAKTRTNIAGQIMATLTAVRAATVFEPVTTTGMPSGTAYQTIEAPGTTPGEPAISETPSAPVASATPATPTVSETAITTVPPSAVMPSTSPTLVRPIVSPTVQQDLQPVYPVMQPIVSIPPVYQLQPGEFPWCIARRFNINPRQLMCLNGFCNGQIFYPGQVILIPQNAQPFPGRRALRPHPASYVVRPGDTIYKIACTYGDIDPISLAQINNLLPPYRLRVGQVLIFP